MMIENLDLLYIPYQFFGSFWAKGTFSEKTQAIGDFRAFVADWMDSCGIYSFLDFFFVGIGI